MLPRTHSNRMLTRTHGSGMAPRTHSTWLDVKSLVRMLCKGVQDSNRCLVRSKRTPLEWGVNMTSPQRSHLLHNSCSAEVPLQAHAACEAELAILRAAHLRGYAQCGPRPAAVRPLHWYDYCLYRACCAIPLHTARMIGGSGFCCAADSGSP